MKQTKLNKCPRCHLPQEGVYRCQYCGYVFAKHEKKYSKAFINRLKDIIFVFNVKSVAPDRKRSTLKDNGGTRSGLERRKYTFSNYFPENRSGSDRRKKIDRRRKVARKRGVERRYSLNHEIPYPRNAQSISKS